MRMVSARTAPWKPGAMRSMIHGVITTQTATISPMTTPSSARMTPANRPAISSSSSASRRA